MSKPTFKRSDRVGDQIKEEIADILMRRIKDPRIGFVTITDVSIAPDLKNATVFVSVFGTDKDKSLSGLKSATPVIRAELGKRMRLRIVPELLFRYDPAVEQGAHMMELLKSIEDERKKNDDDEK
jgi:ribosome-binding factor A